MNAHLASSARRSTGSFTGSHERMSALGRTPATGLMGADVETEPAGGDAPVGPDCGAPGELARVLERTARLEATVKELEAFSYSVSHDLRAPLRTIDGFSSILVDEHRSSLNEDALALLNAIRREAQRMAQLIDDLLSFSHASRQSLDADEISMTDLAECAARVLREAKPDFSCRIEVAPLPSARGDRAMMRQVLANLLGNAVKFSSRNPDAFVQVSGRSEGEWNIYCIRDNGVGFDECYAHRLFGVFERLHRQDEFEGTGVGLALVQRIVQRHGGKVWAESKLGQGATFYFTLPRA